MSDSPKTDELLDRAYRLAFFVHGDAPKAFEIALDARLQLDTAAAAQDKRQDYYTPEQRRTKVIVPREQLLQLLVYVHSEEAEKEQERLHPDALSEEDWLVRFIKYLVEASAGKSSLHMNVAVCRLLFAYSHAESRRIYQWLVLNPGTAFPADAAFSKRKGKLISGLLERFPGRLTVAAGAHNDQCLLRRSDPDQFADVVRQSLEMFTPWGTTCFPDRMPRDLIERELSFNGEVDEEHAVELKRMHTLIHCLDSFTKRFGLKSPRLAVPQFSITSAGGGRGGPRDSRKDPPPLGETELTRLAKEIAFETRRRPEWVGFSVLNA